MLLSDSPVRPGSPHECLWVICWIIPPCNNSFYVSSDDISDAAVTVVFSLFNSQSGTLFMATLLAKEMGEKVKDFLAMKTLMECLFLLI